MSSVAQPTRLTTRSSSFADLARLAKSGSKIIVFKFDESHPACPITGKGNSYWYPIHSDPTRRADTVPSDAVVKIVRVTGLTRVNLARFMTTSGHSTYGYIKNKATQYVFRTDDWENDWQCFLVPPNRLDLPGAVILEPHCSNLRESLALPSATLPERPSTSGVSPLALVLHPGFVPQVPSVPEEAGTPDSGNPIANLPAATAAAVNADLNDSDVWATYLGNGGEESSSTPEGMDTDRTFTTRWSRLPKDSDESYRFLTALINIKSKDFDRICMPNGDSVDLPSLDPTTKVFENGRVKSLAKTFAQLDAVRHARVRFINLIEEQQAPIIPRASPIQIPALTKGDVHQFVRKLNGIFSGAAAEASRALLDYCRDLEQKLMDECGTLVTDGDDWTPEEALAVTKIRLSRKSKLTPYKRNDLGPIVFFTAPDPGESTIKAHKSARVLGTTGGGRTPGNSNRLNAISEDPLPVISHAKAKYRYEPSHGDDILLNINEEVAIIAEDTGSGWIGIRRLTASTDGSFEEGFVPASWLVPLTTNNKGKKGPVRFRSQPTDAPPPPPNPKRKDPPLIGQNVPGFPNPGAPKNTGNKGKAGDQVPPNPPNLGKGKSPPKKKADNRPAGRNKGFQNQPFKQQPQFQQQRQQQQQLPFQQPFQQQQQPLPWVPQPTQFPDPIFQQFQLFNQFQQFHQQQAAFNAFQGQQQQGFGPAGPTQDSNLGNRGSRSNSRNRSNSRGRGNGRPSQAQQAVNPLASTSGAAPTGAPRPSGATNAGKQRSNQTSRP